MIAAAFACFNHKYSRYEFINFKETILYTKSQLFLLEKDRYIVVIFGTHMGNIDKALVPLYIREVPGCFMMKKQNDHGHCKLDKNLSAGNSAIRRR